MAQVKFVIDDELLKKFKQIVLAKHGKIELTPEGEDAIKLYINKYQGLLASRSNEPDSLTRAIGAIRSTKPQNALRDLKELESEES